VERGGGARRRGGRGRIVAIPMGAIPLLRPKIKHHSSCMVLAYVPNPSCAYDRPTGILPSISYTRHPGRDAYRAQGCETVRDRRRGPARGWQASIFGSLRPALPRPPQTDPKLFKSYIYIYISCMVSPAAPLHVEHAAFGPGCLRSARDIDLNLGHRARSE
jgi:hypothetical protein